MASRSLRAARDSRFFCVVVCLLHFCLYFAALCCTLCVCRVLVVCARLSSLRSERSQHSAASVINRTSHIAAVAERGSGGGRDHRGGGGTGCGRSWGGGSSHIRGSARCRSRRSSATDLWCCACSRRRVSPGLRFRRIGSRSGCRDLRRHGQHWIRGSGVCAQLWSARAAAGSHAAGGAKGQGQSEGKEVNTDGNADDHTRGFSSRMLLASIARLQLSPLFCSIAEYPSNLTDLSNQIYSH